MANGDSHNFGQHMLTDGPADRIRQMDRGELINVLRRAECGFRIDFTDEFLAALSMDRLRHIVLAAILQARRVGGPKRRS